MIVKMNIPPGFKLWLLFKHSEQERPACLGSVLSQKVGARAVCDACATRKDNLEPNGWVVVPAREKADPGSEKAGLKTWGGFAVCCHFTERIDVLPGMTEFDLKED